jgi:hypothetical protein
MKLNELDVTRLGTARALPAFQPASGWRGAIAALRARLVRAWIGLYAPPPRRLAPLL